MMTRVRLVYTSKLFSSFDDCNRLDRNQVSKAFAFPVHNARDEDVASHTVCLGSLNHSIIGIESLIWIQQSGSFGRRAIFSKQTLLATL